MDGAVSISWNNGGNWSNGYVPNSTDNVTINNGSSFNLDVGGLSSATTQVTGVTINGTVNASSSGSVGVQGNLVVAGTAVFGNAGAHDLGDERCVERASALRWERASGT